MIAFLIACISLSIVSAQNSATTETTPQDVTGAVSTGTWTAASSGTGAVANTTINASDHVQQQSIIIPISILCSLFISFLLGHTR